MKQVFAVIKRLLDLIPKKLRGTVYAVAVLGLVVLAILDGYDVGPVDGWIDQAVKIAGIVGGVLSLAHLRDPGEGTGTE